MRIGVFCPNWVGDAVMALPFLTACRQENPVATILVICKSWVAPIFENHASVDGIVSFQRKDLNGYRSTRNSGQSLKSLDLDYFYLLSDSFRSAYLAKESESKHRIGYPGQGRSGYLTQIIPSPKIKMHQTEQYLNLLNGDHIELNLKQCGIQLLEEEISWARMELHQIGLSNPIALFPFSVASSRSVPQLKILEIIESKYKVKKLEENYEGEVAKRYVLEDYLTEFGFISSVSQPFCSTCTRARITMDGKLVTCLFANSGIDLRKPIREGCTSEELDQIIKNVWLKRKDKYSEIRHELTNSNYKKIEMFQIGG